jgi:hypothetical protein
MGIFYYVDDAAGTVGMLRQQGHAGLSVFSPVPHHDIERALGQGPRRALALGGCRCTGGFAQWSLRVVRWWWEGRS